MGGPTERVPVVHLLLETAYTRMFGIRDTSVCGLAGVVLATTAASVTCPRCKAAVDELGYRRHP